MLTRTPADVCIQCGRAYGAPGFRHYHGRPQEGAAYFCDRGVLCSPECALDHYRTREAEGSVPTEPAPEPMPARRR